MKARKILLIVCTALFIALTLLSCKKDKEVVYYRSTVSKQALTSSTQISLGGYSFDSFLDGGRIKVSEKRGDFTYYGVLSERGETVLPVAYVSLAAAGNFFVAEGGETQNRHYVFSKDGREICVFDERIEVADVGAGYFSVSTKNAAYLYDGEGRNVLPGSLMDSSYRFSVCGNFAIAKSSEKGGTFIFDLRTSDTVRAFFDGENRTYLVAYVGGNEFVVAVTDRLESAEEYDVAIDREEGPVYYKQTVRRYTAGVSEPTTLSLDRFIVKINNRYSVGLTEEDRANYALHDGYSAVAYYVTDGKKASGALNYYLTDSSMKELKALPEGVSAMLTPVDGVAAVLNNEGALLLLDEKANVLRRIDDAVYQNVVFSGEIVTAAKVTETGVRLGGFDREGNVVLPFEYSYISTFFGGKAIASKGGKSYIVTTSGAETYIGDYAIPYYFEGFYQSTSGDRVGATSFDGTELIAPNYTDYAAVRRCGDNVFIALTIGSVTDVYRLY